MVVWNMSYVPLLPVGSDMLSLKLSSQLPINSVREGAICAAPCALADAQPNLLYEYTFGFIPIIFYINVYFCTNIYTILYYTKYKYTSGFFVDHFLSLCLYPDVIHCLRLFSGCIAVSSFIMQSHLGLRCPVTLWVAAAII